MKRLNQILKSRGIHGLVILPPRENELPPGLDFSGLSTATIDLSLRSPDLPRTSPDYFAGAVLAMKTLRRKGYRRIGFCTNLEELHRIGDRWLGGVLFAQHSFPAEEQILPYITPEAKSQKMTEFWQEMRGDFFRWLDRCRPDVLLSNCLYFYQWAEESGRRIPGQIGFASLSSDMPTVSENDISIRHPVSGVDQQNEKVAARALDLVANRIYNNEFGLIPDPEMVLIPPVWRDGATLRP